MSLKYATVSEPLHISLVQGRWPPRARPLRTVERQRACQHPGSHRSSSGPSQPALDTCTHTKVDVRLPGKENSNSHGARPIHLIITMIKWIRTSRSSKKLSLYLHPANQAQTLQRRLSAFARVSPSMAARDTCTQPTSYFAEMCSGSEAGSYLRFKDF